MGKCQHVDLSDLAPLAVRPGRAGNKSFHWKGLEVEFNFQILSLSLLPFNENASSPYEIILDGAFAYEGVTTRYHRYS